ncbi:hypothetical protein QVN85_10420 [Oscillibacter valericigenes]|nr:hypothetical protein [Oscillibacter valericigenes]
MGECFIVRRGESNTNVMPIASVAKTSGNAGAVCTIPKSKIPIGYNLYIVGAVDSLGLSGGIKHKLDGNFTTIGYGSYFTDYNSQLVYPSCTVSGDNVIFTISASGFTANVSNKSYFCGILVPA